jgi:ATP-binding cassette subfamily B protein
MIREPGIARGKDHSAKRMQKQKAGSLSLLWGLFRGSRILYLLAFFFMVLTVACNFLLPQLVRFVVDNVVGGGDAAEIPLMRLLTNKLGGAEALRGNLLLAGVLVLLIALVGGICQYIYRKCLAMGSEGMMKRLRDKLYNHIQFLPYEWHVRIQTGDIIQRCTSDAEVVRNFVANQLLEMIRTIILVLFAYVLLFPMNFTMAMASFAFLPVIFLYSFIFLSLTAKRFLAADEAEGQLLSVAQENLTGVRVVRAFGREKYEVDRFDKQNRNFAELWMRLGKLLSTYWGLGDLIAGLQMVTICVVGVLQALEGNISVGGFMVFLSYNSMTIWPVRGLGRILSEASKTKVSLGRLGEILSAEQEADADSAREAPVDGDIAFENVTFSYGEKEVLRGVSFTARRGKTLGILGATGSGKTTVAHLLCRLYDLDPAKGEGEIKIGGVNINQYRRRWLRRNVGIVMQEPFLYSRTIRENIAALSPAHVIEDIREAAQIACVDDAVTEFELGYDTIIGERGVTLSGGQKQRVAIARTILSKPPVMIFDDSLSAVDTETDAKIREALSRRTENVTTIIIAHRITSLSRADQVIVMDEGKILEMGSPAELMALNGVYRRIHDMQESVEEEVSGL